MKAGDKVNRLCPQCGAQLLVRQNKANANLFLGCPRWPDCDYTEPIPEAVRMEAVGHKRLPGM